MGFERTTDQLHSSSLIIYSCSPSVCPSAQTLGVKGLALCMKDVVRIFVLLRNVICTKSK